MASVAKCPQCEHDLLIPDGVDLAGWAKCPACSAFFQLAEVTLRDVAKPILVDSDFAPVQSNDEDEVETDVDSRADEQAESEWRSGSSSPKTLADYAAPVEVDEPFTVGAHEQAEESSPDESEFHEGDIRINHKRAKPRRADLKGFGAPQEVESAEDEAPAEKALETPGFSTSAEIAAVRIEKWFSSADTVPDVRPFVAEEPPAVEPHPLTGDIAYDPPFEQRREVDAATPAKDASASDTHSPDEWGSTDLEIASVDPTARTLDEISPSAPVERQGATVEFDAKSLAAVDADFELEGPMGAQRGARPWDDSEHMERLLADADPNALEPVAPVIHQSVTPEKSPAGEEDAASWMMEHPLRGPRKRSVVRTMMTTVVGGLVGMAIGYYAWLLAMGPRGDFLEVSQYFPSAFLPASFPALPNQLTNNTTAVPATEDDSPSEIGAEMPARFEADVKPADSATASDDDRYAAAATATPSEPSKFEEPPAATPLAGTTAPPTTHLVSGAPSFSVDELAVTLRAAQDAQPGLVAGTLNEGKAVQQTKGKSYSALSELAEKLTFVDASSQGDYATALARDAEKLFRETLSNAHTRGEVARIAPIWISSPNRHIGGVFFAGNLTAQSGQGPVVEWQVDLGSGTPITVLLTDELAAHRDTAGKSMCVVGSIIEQPTKRVTGYSGSAKQAVWVRSLIPLE